MRESPRYCKKYTELIEQETLRFTEALGIAQWKLHWTRQICKLSDLHATDLETAEELAHDVRKFVKDGFKGLE